MRRNYGHARGPALYANIKTPDVDHGFVPIPTDRLSITIIGDYFDRDMVETIALGLTEWLVDVSGYKPVVINDVMWRLSAPHASPSRAAQGYGHARAHGIVVDIEAVGSREPGPTRVDHRLHIVIAGDSFDRFLVTQIRDALRKWLHDTQVKR